MRIVCWQTILMKYHTLFFPKLEKTSQKLSSAAVVIGALSVKTLSDRCLGKSVIDENILMSTCLIVGNRLRKSFAFTCHLISSCS